VGRALTPCSRPGSAHVSRSAPDSFSESAPNALAANVSQFELARVMGNSPEMIERHYGTLLDGSAESIAARLASFEAQQERGSHRDTDAHVG
jgi:hypothetical protein